MAEEQTEEKVHGIILENGKVMIETILSDEFQERPPYFNISTKSMGYLFLDGLLKEIYASYSMVYDRDGLNTIADSMGNKVTKNPVIGIRYQDANGNRVTVQVDLINGKLWKDASQVTTLEGVKALAQGITSPTQGTALKA